jgi:hypothetical protein
MLKGDGGRVGNEIGGLERQVDQVGHCRPWLDVYLSDSKLARFK